MRRVVCREFGPPDRLVLAEAPDPEPGPGQVLVGVRAAGVSFVDGLMAGDVPPADLRSHSGVTCRLCHGIETTTKDGNGSYMWSRAPLDAWIWPSSVKSDQLNSRRRIEASPRTYSPSSGR